MIQENLRDDTRGEPSGPRLVSHDVCAIIVLVCVPLYAQVPQATALYEQARFEEAKRLLAPMTSDADALLLSGKIALLQEDDETASATLEKAARFQAAEVKRRDNFQGHRAYAKMYTRQKKLDLARKEYVDAVREEPSSAAAHTALAGFYAANEKNYPAAFSELDAALSGASLQRGEEARKKYLAYRPKESEPSLLVAYYYLGLIYEKQSRKPEARAAFASALKINPRWKELQDSAKRVAH